MGDQGDPLVPVMNWISLLLWGGCGALHTSALTARPMLVKDRDQRTGNGLPDTK